MPEYISEQITTCLDALKSDLQGKAKTAIAEKKKDNTTKSTHEKIKIFHDEKMRFVMNKMVEFRESRQNSSLTARHD